VRGRGLLGARYVELRPGSSANLLAPRSTLRTASATSLAYGLPDVLDTFDTETRGALGETLRGLGQGLLARGSDLNETLRLAPEGGPEAQRIVAALLERPGAVERFVPSLNGAAGALDDARNDIAATFRPTVRALQPFVDREASVDQTLATSPSTLRAARPALDAGTKLLAAVEQVATAANKTLPAAPRGLRATTRLLTRSRRPLARTASLLDSARPAVKKLLTVTDAAKPVLTPLRVALDGLIDPISRLGAYGCDVRNMVNNWHSALGFGTDAGRDYGPLNNFRVTVAAGTEALTGIQPLSSSPVADRDYYPPPCKYPQRAVGSDLLPPTGSK